MKKTLAFLLLLTLTLGMVGTALAEETGTLPWRGYALEATWLSTNRADINIPNLRSDGHFALVRLAPMEGTIDYDVINEHAGNDIFLRLANGKKIPLASVLYHKLITKGGGFPQLIRNKTTSMRFSSRREKQTCSARTGDRGRPRAYHRSGGTGAKSRMRRSV